MTESQLLSFLAIFVTGLIIGVLATLLFNKVRSGKASAGAVKREFDDYQAKVEEHFDETSEKFKAMAEQYKDLYQHLSVGATSLCRPEHVVAGLTDQSDPLQPLPKPEKESTKTAIKKGSDSKIATPADTKTEPKPAVKSTSNQNSAAELNAKNTDEASKGKPAAKASEGVKPDSNNNPKQPEKTAAKEAVDKTKKP